MKVLFLYIIMIVFYSEFISHAYCSVEKNDVMLDVKRISSNNYKVTIFNNSMDDIMVSGINPETPVLNVEKKFFGIWIFDIYNLGIRKADVIIPRNNSVTYQAEFLFSRNVPYRLVLNYIVMSSNKTKKTFFLLKE